MQRAPDGLDMVRCFDPKPNKLQSLGLRKVGSLFGFSLVLVVRSAEWGQFLFRAHAKAEPRTR